MTDLGHEGNLSQIRYEISAHIGSKEKAGGSKFRRPS